ncbi:helix-turn-helix transcriptional regulator [Bradyrhizobium sp. Arg314]
MDGLQSVNRGDTYIVRKVTYERFFVINSEQIKAARALTSLTQEDVAGAAGLSVQTIKRMEALGTGRSSADNVMAVERALEAAGVVFIPENGGGAGVRLAKPRV